MKWGQESLPTCFSRLVEEVWRIKKDSVRDARGGRIFWRDGVVE